MYACCSFGTLKTKQQNFSKPGRGTGTLDSKTRKFVEESVVRAKGRV